MTDVTRPVMRWHGGKWMLAAWIIEHFPPHRIYTEVFGGGASVLLRKPRAYCEIYNDLDRDAVNVFRTLRDRERGAALIEACRLTSFAREEFLETYEPAEELSDVERARRMIARSFMGFGSNSSNAAWRTGFRVALNRSGTTPAHDWANYPDALASVVERLRGVVIEHRPAVSVLTQRDELDALHYVDPPYVHSTRTNHARAAQRYAHEMTDDDHRELSAVLHCLRGMVVLSGYPSPLYDELYRDWVRVDRLAYADGGSPRTECLWLSPRTAAALEQSRSGVQEPFAFGEAS